MMPVDHKRKRDTSPPPLSAPQPRRPISFLLRQTPDDTTSASPAAGVSTPSTTAGVSTPPSPSQNKLVRGISTVKSTSPIRKEFSALCNMFDATQHPDGTTRQRCDDATLVLQKNPPGYLTTNSVYEHSTNFPSHHAQMQDYVSELEQTWKQFERKPRTIGDALEIFKEHQEFKDNLSKIVTILKGVELTKDNFIEVALDFREKGYHMLSKAVIALFIEHPRNVKNINGGYQTPQESDRISNLFAKAQKKYRRNPDVHIEDGKPFVYFGGIKFPAIDINNPDYSTFKTRVHEGANTVNKGQINYQTWFKKNYDKRNLDLFLNSLMNHIINANLIGDEQPNRHLLVNNKIPHLSILSPNIYDRFPKPSEEFHSLYASVNPEVRANARRAFNVISATYGVVTGDLDTKYCGPDTVRCGNAGIMHPDYMENYKIVIPHHIHENYTIHYNHDHSRITPLVIDNDFSYTAGRRFKGLPYPDSVTPYPCDHIDFPPTRHRTLTAFPDELEKFDYEAVFRLVPLCMTEKGEIHPKIKETIEKIIDGFFDFPEDDPDAKKIKKDLTAEWLCIEQGRRQSVVYNRMREMHPYNWKFPTEGETKDYMQKVTDEVERWNKEQSAEI